MKVYIVNPYYKYDGGGGHTIKGFLSEDKAYSFKETLDEWKEREPKMYDLSVNCEAVTTDEEWEEFDKKYELWQSEFEGIPMFSDGFVVEEVEVVE